MRKLVLHIVLLMALILASACVRKEIYREEVRLALSLRFSEPILTKAGDVSAMDEERRLTSLQVWVFRSSDGLFIGHLSPDVTDFQDGEEERLYLLLDESIAKSRPLVDVYAVANLESTNLNLSKESTRAQLNEALIQDCFFGNGYHSQLEEPIPLPYSGVSRGCSLVGNYPVLNVGTVHMGKAVSKIRFVMSQVSEDGVNPLDNFSITSISLDGGQIPTNEFLFNISGNAYRVNDVYEEDAVSIPVSTGPIPVCLSPEDYAYTGQNAQVYESLIDAAVSAGTLGSTPAYYLRESPLALRGTISYTIGDKEPASIPFSMQSEGDFARNHSWIVYIYYSSGKVQFTTTYTPWENGGDFYLTEDD